MTFCERPSEEEKKPAALPFLTAEAHQHLLNNRCKIIPTTRLVYVRTPGTQSKAEKYFRITSKTAEKLQKNKQIQKTLPGWISSLERTYPDPNRSIIEITEATFTQETDSLGIESRPYLNHDNAFSLKASGAHLNTAVQWFLQVNKRNDLEIAKPNIKDRLASIYQKLPFSIRMRSKYISALEKAKVNLGEEALIDLPDFIKETFTQSFEQVCINELKAAILPFNLSYVFNPNSKKYRVRTNHFQYHYLTNNSETNQIEPNFIEKIGQYPTYSIITRSIMDIIKRHISSFEVEQCQSIEDFKEMENKAAASLTMLFNSAAKDFKRSEQRFMFEELKKLSTGIIIDSIGDWSTEYIDEERSRNQLSPSPIERIRKTKVLIDTMRRLQKSSFSEFQLNLPYE